MKKKLLSLKKTTPIFGEKIIALLKKVGTIFQKKKITLIFEKTTPNSKKKAGSFEKNFSNF